MKQKKCLLNTIKNLNNINLYIYENLRFSLRKKKQPMNRKWQPDLHKIGDIKDNNGRALEQYKLLSYNILAQDLLLDNMFLYYDIDKRFLKWNFRLDQIIQEVSKLNPDMLCLQEVQHTHLCEIVQQLRSRGSQKRRLEYVFKKRTGDRCDGCAIVYDRDRLKLIEDKSVEYFNREDAILNRENVALMAKFELRGEPGTVFISANTHLLYNPRRSEIRIGQINKLLSVLKKFSEIKGNKRCPILLAGDFNCQNYSNEYKLLTSFWKPEAQFTLNDADKDLQMQSIEFGIDAASTFQGEWVTVDFIFKSFCKQNEKNVQINSIYKLPPIDSCKINGKLPNQFNGSDHLSLAIQFSIV